MISLNAIGKDTRHTGDFCIWRPDGSGDNLLVIFKTSALLIIDGNEIIVPPDSLIIYKKDTPQYYRPTICGNYANHFIHFNVTDDRRDTSRHRGDGQAHNLGEHLRRGRAA